MFDNIRSVETENGTYFYTTSGISYNGYFAVYPLRDCVMTGMDILWNADHRYIQTVGWVKGKPSVSLLHTFLPNL